MAAEGALGGPDEDFDGEDNAEDLDMETGLDLLEFHPEAKIDTRETVYMNLNLTNVPPNFKNPDGAMDTRHRSPPFLLQFERTRILGFRTNQLSQGARPYIVVPAHVTDLHEIAKLELEARRLPFIVKRPMPNGTFEYWRLSDLLIL
jgi:DNA-directed RNA polymerase I, II, and III subunit RPABC2